MAAIYFTLTGAKHYFGTDFLKPEMKLLLRKEPDNDYDKEAIRVELEGLGKIGYVANSPYTVTGESFSAGRLYDRIADTATGTVLYIVGGGVLCTLDDDSVLYTPPACRKDGRTAPKKRKHKRR